MDITLNQSTRKMYDDVRTKQRVIDGGRPLRYVVNSNLRENFSCHNGPVSNPVGVVCNQMNVGANNILASNELYAPKLTNLNELIVQKDINKPNNNVYNYSKSLSNKKYIDALNNALLVPGTRVDKSENLPGVEIDRFHILDKNPQQVGQLVPMSSTIEINNICMNM